MNLFRSVLIFPFLLLLAVFGKAQTTTTLTFYYTGGPQTFTVPQSCISDMTITCAGAPGGLNPGSGYGSIIRGTLPVSPGNIYYIFVGHPTNRYNGGGSSGFNNSIATCNGGGASDVRFGGTTLTNRIIVAGGGGGRGAPGEYGNGSAKSISCGGSAGGASGGDGQSLSGGGGGGKGAIGSAGGLAGQGCSYYNSTAGASGTLGQGGSGGYPYTTTNLGGCGGGGGGGYIGGGGGGAGGTYASGTSVCSGLYEGGCGGGGAQGTSYMNTAFTNTFFSSNGISFLNDASVVIQYKVSTFSTTVSSSSSLSCGGSSVILSANTPANSYSWSTGATSSTINVNPALNTVYTVTTSVNGSSCSSTASIYIASGSTPVLSISANNSTVCGGNSVGLSVNGAVSYTWSIGNVQTSTINVMPLVSSCYSVTGSSVEGCTNTTSQCITVLPTPSLTISGTDSLCAGSIGILSVSGADTYTWNVVPGGNTVSVMPVSSTCYSVIGIAITGCTAMASHCVNVLPGPSINISGTNTLCQGLGEVLSASGALTYSWNTGSSTDTIAVAAQSTTCYSVTGTAVNGCTTMASHCISILPLPVLTISGLDSLCFGSGTTFSVSGAATYTWSDASTGNSITSSPAVDTCYSVQGTAINGCTNIASHCISILSLPVLTVSGVDSLCLGSGTTFSVSGAATYTWSDASIANTISIAPALNTCYSVTGTAVNSCTIMASHCVSILPLPVVTVSGVDSLCFGSGTTFSVSGADTYTWSDASTGNSITLSPAVDTCYSVQGTAINGCTNIASHCISILSRPVLTVSGVDSLCFGSGTTFSVSGATTYTWSDASTGNSITLSPAADTCYSVQGTAINGCTNIASHCISILSLPVLTVSGVDSLCLGSGTTFSVSGAATYTWSDASTGNSITLSPAADTCYSVQGTAINGCTNIASHCISILSLPVLPVSGVDSLCLGSGTTFSVSGANTYTWSNTVVGNAISIVPASNSCFSVTGTAISGCTNSTSHCITVLNGPILNASGPSSICSGLNATITVSANSISNYTWFAAGSFPGSDSSVIVVSPISNTGYTVIGSNSYGCLTQTVVDVIVIEGSQGSITSSPGNIICAGEALILSASNTQNCLWTNSVNSNTLNTPSIFVYPVINTTYSVAGTNSNGCPVSSTIDISVTDCSGITERTESGDKVILYPNPSVDQITIHSATDMQFQVYNQMGQAVRSIKLSADNNFTMIIDCLDTGVYFIREQNKEFPFFKKIVVSR